MPQNSLRFAFILENDEMILTIVKFIQRCGLTAEELNQHIYCCSIADGIPTVEFQIKAKWPVVKLSCKSGLCSFWHERFMSNKVKFVYFMTIPRQRIKSVKYCFFCTKLTKESKHYSPMFQMLFILLLLDIWPNFPVEIEGLEGNKELYIISIKKKLGTHSPTFITYFARVFRLFVCTPRK